MAFHTRPCDIRLGVMVWLVVGLFFPLQAHEFLRHRWHQTLTQWYFYPGDIQSAESGDPISLEGWERVTVPHTWNAKDVLTEGPRYRQGVSWYRTEFETPTDSHRPRAFLRFEGVCLVADVFLNGLYLGRHQGGYAAFCFEITPYLREKGVNRLAVKVDNSLQPDVAPSGPHLYPLFGGIYRPVTVFTTAEFCISPLYFASSGVFLRPRSVDREKAFVEASVLLDDRRIPVLRRRSAELVPPNGRKGPGLLGAYYDNLTFSGKPRHIRIDPAIDFDYGAGGPSARMPDDGFSIRWTGFFVPKKSGPYRFQLHSDDGSRLIIDGERVVDHWGDHAATTKWGEIRLEAGRRYPLELLYYERGGEASIRFGWVFFDETSETKTAWLRVTVYDREGHRVVGNDKEVTVPSDTAVEESLFLCRERPRLWEGRRDPYLYTARVTLETPDGRVIDRVDQPLGLRYFHVDRDSGLILNGKAYPLYGVCRHQEWEGLGSALTNWHHRRDIEDILELGATGIRLAHYQQADTMYTLCNRHGLVVWAEIPNTPVWRGENLAYLHNCRQQLEELIWQNYNHPSIFFWGLYNEIPISDEALRDLHETAKRIDPYRLTTQADFTEVMDRHVITDLAAWNWYFGWYYGDWDQYPAWFDRLHAEHPNLLAGLSEYGADGCISQQQDPPKRPHPTQGRFFPEQYQRLYHEEVWRRIKDRRELWCKFIWNMYDFSWTGVVRGDRPYINHKGLITHDRKTRKDAFYFYKAHWSDEPVLYLLNRRWIDRTDSVTTVSVYTNCDSVDLYVNGTFVSRKLRDAEHHKIMWGDVPLRRGRNRIEVIGSKAGGTYTDACLWTLTEGEGSVARMGH